jgi:HPt (histidine-containing phosphotransfer) domain-containing protein
MALLTRIEGALAARNAQEFRSILHAMKGSSASMGTDRLTRLCTDFGKLSDAEVRLRAAGLASALSNELAAARGALESYLRDKQRSTG